MNLREEGKSVRNKTLEAWRTGAIGPKLEMEQIIQARDSGKPGK